MIGAESSYTAKDIISAVVPVALASSLGLASLWLQEWRSRRNSEARRRHALDEARAYLGFLGEWDSAPQAITANPSVKLTNVRATEILEDLLGEIENSFSGRSPSENIGIWIPLRRFLWLYPLRSIMGSMARLLYYTLFVWAFVFGMYGLLSPGSWGERIGVFAVFWLIALVFLVPLWWLVYLLSPNSGLAERRGQRSVPRETAGSRQSRTAHWPPRNGDR